MRETVLSAGDAPYTVVARLAQSVTDPSLVAQVSELARIIADTRSELQRIEVGPFVDGQIPAATDELDEVVNHTASATDAILAVCEELEQIQGTIDPARLQAATTRIYEACSFQDITGQRISKVVSTLKAIEGKVKQILEVFGGGEAPPPPAPGPVSLTNGPQMPGVAMDQSDIDKLLADF
jgi:chemotaxis protein CheZ